LLVRALDAGATFETLELSGDVDDLFFDRERGLLYAACGEGCLGVFERDAPGRLRPLGRVPTAAGARTCLFAGEEKRLFVACPERERSARVLVFRTP
jgi:sugar lactone lactonase YvrE